MHKPRLTRLARIHLRQPLYFITLCTFSRKNILAEPIAHEAFILFCEAGPAHGAFVGRYVLMPDHLHLFVTFTPEGVTLSDWVKSLKNTLSKSWRSSQIAAPHWQKGFFDHVMRSADSYSEKWNYVAANPVRAGLSGSPDSWPYQGSIHELHF
jgi:putative transposase